jgi:transcriptional regulator with XRE-family HTH domain
VTPRERTAVIIRQAADRSGLSNAEIARRAGISKSTITEAIRGVYGLRLETLELIVAACGFKLEVIVRSENPPTSETSQQNIPKA